MTRSAGTKVSVLEQPETPDVVRFDAHPWFDAIPVALSFEDFTGAAAVLDELRSQGVVDIGRHFADHPADLDDAISSVIVRAVNPALLELRQLPPEQLLGPIARCRIDDELRRSMTRQFVAIWNGVTSMRTIARDDFRNLDLIIDWWISNRDGVIDPSGVLVAFSDITAEKRATEEIRQSLARRDTLYEIGLRLASTVELEPAFQAIVESLRRLLECDVAALFTLDHECREIVDHLMVCEEDEICSWISYDALLEQLVPIALEHDGVVVDRDPPAEGIDRWPQQLGLDLRYTSMALVPFTGSSSRQGLILAINTDERRRLGPPDLTDLRMLANSASVAVQRTEMHERTAAARDELQDVVDQLQAAQRSLVQASRLESIGHLAAGVAHEVNTPIQFIGDNVRYIGEIFSEALEALATIQQLAAEATGESPALAKIARMLTELDTSFLQTDIPAAVEQTIEGVDRVATIVRALKEYAHPGQSEPSELVLTYLITTAVNVTKNEWSDVATLDVDLDDAPTTIRGRRAELVQVLTNLIVNASQALAESRGRNGEGHIRISARSVDGGTEIRVSDDGPGIPAELQARIFDQFFTTKPVGYGTGLGLAMVHSTIVGGHGGTVRVESAPGEGCTFVLELPNP